MTTDQPTCTAMVTHTGKLMPPPGGMQTGGPYVPCGAPVSYMRMKGAERAVPPTGGGAHVDNAYGWVHVSLDGPCGECGHPALDEAGETTHWLSGVGPVCGECESGELYEGNPLPGKCAYVPTLIEIPSDHEAQR